LRAGEAIAFAHPEVGACSIFVADGERHRQIRRALAPAFRASALAGYVPAMIEVTDAAVARWPRDRPFGVLPRIRALALEVVAHALFGLRAPEQVQPLVAAMLRLLDLLAVPGLVYPAFQRELSPWWRAFVRIRADVRAQLQRVLEARRRDADSRGDVLGLVARERDDDAAIDQLISMLVAGHETTAIAVAWALQAVIARPEIAFAIRAEIAGIVGRGPLAAEHLPRLGYLGAVIHETLRLWPPLPLVVRRLAEPLALDGYRLPAGVTVAPCSYLLHRDPALWRDPARFDPARFVEREPPAHFVPFGGGVRRCLGMSFAVDEIKVVFVRLLRERIALAGASSRPHRRWVTLSPRPDVQLVLA
jgi:cytochrome P450 family 135